MKKDTIITLENGKDYILLDSSTQEGKEYFVAVEYKKDENKATNNYKFFEEIKNGEDIYIQEVVDENIIKLLIAVFTVNYADMIREDME